MGEVLSAAQVRTSQRQGLEWGGRLHTAEVSDSCDMAGRGAGLGRDGEEMCDAGARAERRSLKSGERESRV